MADIYHGRTVIGCHAVVPDPDPAPKNALLARHLVVDPRSVFIDGIGSGRRAAEIRRGRVRLQKVREEKDSGAGETIPRDDTARKRLAGQRVANGSAGSAEIPIALSWRRYGRVINVSLADARSLISAEKVRPVLDHRPAYRKSELVLRQLRFSSPRQLREGVEGIQLLIAQKLPGRSVQIVSARFGNHENLQRMAPIFGSEVRSLHFELGDRVHVGDSGAALVERLIGGETVNLKLRTVAPVSIPLHRGFPIG